jgi:hypothetical protein
MLESPPPADPSTVNSLAEKFVPRFSVLHPWRRYLLKGGVEAVASLLQPGENAVLIAYAKIGVHPAVIAAAGLVGLDILEPLFLKPHIVGLTARRLLLIQLSIWDYRGKRLRLAAPREAVSVVRAKETWFYFSVWVRKLDDGEIIRFNFPNPGWEREGRSLASALGYHPK